MHGYYRFNYLLVTENLESSGASPTTSVSSHHVDISESPSELAASFFYDHSIRFAPRTRSSRYGSGCTNALDDEHAGGRAAQGGASVSIPANSTRRGTRTLSFEVMPPRRPDVAPRFWNTVSQFLETQPDFLSVTYGAGGQDRSTARHVVRRLVRDTPIQPIAHLTCVRASREEVVSVISDYLESGVRTFLALRGDPPADDATWRPAADGVASATELVNLIRALEQHRNMVQPGAALRAAFKPLTIAVATFPSGNPEAGTTPEQEIERLLLKQVAGADFAITQLFFEAQDYISFVEKARAYGVTIPIMAGILVPTEPRRLARVAELTKVVAPTRLVEDLSRASDEADLYRRGIAHGSALAREILDAGAPGIHFYTFNKAQPALDLLDELPELTPTN